MSETLGTAVVDILGNLAPLTSAFSAGKGMASGFVNELGSTLMNGVKMFIVPFMTALSLDQAMKSWMGKEEVIMRLSSALKAAGDNVDYFEPRLIAVSNAIQKVTTHSNESILSVMAHAKAVGMEATQLEVAAKAAVGLSAAYGMSLQGAMQMIIRASQGHTMRLKMYGIQIDENATKEEKYRQLLELGTKSMKLAEEQAGTLTGRMKQLGNVISDMAAVVGQGLSEPLKESSEQAEKAINLWTEKMEELRQSGVFAGIAAAFLNICNVIYTIVKVLIQWIGGVFSFIYQTVSTVVDGIVALVMLVYGAVRKLMGLEPSKSWKDIIDDAKRYAGESLNDRLANSAFGTAGERIEQSFKDAQEVFARNTMGFADTRGKTPHAGGAMKQSVEGKAGEMFGFAEAWSRLQKESLKAEDSENLKKIASATSAIASNTASKGSVLPANTPPLSSVQAQKYAPGESPILMPPSIGSPSDAQVKAALAVYYKNHPVGAGA